MRERLIEKVYATHKTLTRAETAAILDTILNERRDPDEAMGKAAEDAMDG
jgi:hypothetical protein